MACSPYQMVASAGKTRRSVSACPARQAVLADTVSRGDGRAVGVGATARVGGATPTATSQADDCDPYDREAGDSARTGYGHSRCLMQIADLALSSMAQRSDVEDVTPFCVHDSVLTFNRSEPLSIPVPDATTRSPDLSAT